MNFLPTSIVLFVLLLSSCSNDRPQPQGQPALPKDPIVDLKARLTENPNDAEAWFHLADLYERNGLFAEEIEALKRSLAIDVGSGYAYVKMGTAQNRLGRFDDAIVSFQKAKNYQSQNPVLFNNLAYALGKTGNVDGQIEALKRAVSLRPSYVTARYNLGMAYFRKGMRERALAEARALENIDEGAAASLRTAIQHGTN
jgi:tetratricopeptide (TPR) repeat protein